MYAWPNLWKFHQTYWTCVYIPRQRVTADTAVAGPNAVPDDEAAYAHQAHHLTSPQVEAILADTMDSSDNSDIIILSTADHDRLTMDAARQGMGMSTGAGASGRPISSEREHPRMLPATCSPL